MDLVFWLSLVFFGISLIFTILAFYGIYRSHWSDAPNMAVGICALAFVMFGYSSVSIKLLYINPGLAITSGVLLAIFIALSITTFIRILTVSIDWLTIFLGITSIVALTMAGLLIRIGFVSNIGSVNVGISNLGRGLFTLAVLGSLIFYFLAFIGFYSAYYTNKTSITLLVIGGGLFCASSAFYIVATSQYPWLCIIPFGAILLLGFTVIANECGWSIGVEAWTFFASMCLQIIMIPLIWCYSEGMLVANVKDQAARTIQKAVRKRQAAKKEEAMQQVRNANEKAAAIREAAEKRTEERKAEPAPAPTEQPVAADMEAVKRANEEAAARREAADKAKEARAVSPTPATSAQKEAAARRIQAARRTQVARRAQQPAAKQQATPQSAAQSGRSGGA